MAQFGLGGIGPAAATTKAHVMASEAKTILILWCLIVHPAGE